MRVPLVSLVLLLVRGVPGWAHTSPEEYQRYFAEAERAKQAGNFAAMEAALTEALRHGPGDEYAWRSLAWAQARQGKWAESLRNAYENIRRNGECAWSLRQLFDSAMVAGDVKLARRTLERGERLPASLRNADMESDRQRLIDAIGTRTYSLTWKGTPPATERPGEPVRILIPQLRQGKRQRMRVTVENAVSWRTVREANRDLLEVVPKPGEPIVIRGTVTIRGILLGPKRLARVPPGPCPARLRPYLGPFRNRVDYDPAFPDAAALGQQLKGRTSAETVQNVLDWLAANMKYEDGYSDALPDILRTHRGVCHHYSNLMVTLCRAAGVPALVAHGNKLPATGSFTNHGGSHGWVEVYINTIGWVPVEPLNAGSLRVFGGTDYLFYDTSGHTPDDDHFRFYSLQGWPMDGEVLEARLP